MELTGLHLGLEVEDLPRALRFWEPLFAAAGFAFQFGDGKTYAGYRNGSLGLVLAATKPRRVAREAPTGQEFVVSEHLGLHAARREDVDAVASAMAAAGFQPLFPAKEYPEFGPGFYAVTFDDPDHNVIEFAWRPPVPAAA